MALTIFEIVSALCTLIAIVCASAVLIMGILTFTIPHFLWFTELQVPTFAGIIAGFVTIPTMLRIKTSKRSEFQQIIPRKCFFSLKGTLIKCNCSSPQVDRVFGYTVCYQRLAVLVCVALHFSSTIITLIAALTTKCLNKRMFKLMRKYHCQKYAKELVDNIQLSLQCCGARRYRDWYKIDWTNTNFDGNDDQAKG